MINYIDSNKCVFCNNFPEIFNTCFTIKVRELWENVEQWIFVKTGISISFTKNIIIFGMIDDKMAKNINWLIINIKY